MTGIANGNEELKNRFTTISSDYVLYHNIFDNRNEFQTFRTKYIEFIEEYPFEIADDWKNIFQPCYTIEQHLLISRIRALINMDSDRLCIEMKKIQYEKQLVYERVTVSFDEVQKENFKKCIDAAEKAFQSKDDHAYYLERVPMSYMNTVLYRIADELINKGILKYRNEIKLLSSKKYQSL